MSETRYKFLRLRSGEIRSEYGDHTWTVGVGYTVAGPVETCDNGFHCSERMGQAFGCVQGEVVARVEVSGSVDRSSDKEAWETMRIIDARLWRKGDSVALAVFAARLVLENFERVFPDDLRPRQAIEAAERYAADPTDANESAARSAARSAAESAWSAESAAWSAARSAAWSAESAAWSAARSAESGIGGRISDWMETRFESLPKVGAE